MDEFEEKVFGTDKYFLRNWDRANQDATWKKIKEEILALTEGHYWWEKYE